MTIARRTEASFRLTCIRIFSSLARKSRAGLLCGIVSSLVPVGAIDIAARQVRRRCIFWLMLLSYSLMPAVVHADDTEAWQTLKVPGTIVLFRHAVAPGGGDPANFVAGDCRTQRNLDGEGREQARRIGSVLRQRGVQVSEVWHSEWCRTRDTAQLAFPGMPAGKLRPVPAFNSFFSNPGGEAPQIADARAMLLRWSGPGTLVVVTHQVNITSLTGVFPRSGEGVVLQSDGAVLRVKGTVLP